MDETSVIQKAIDREYIIQDFSLICHAFACISVIWYNMEECNLIVKDVPTNCWLMIETNNSYTNRFGQYTILSLIQIHLKDNRKP